jgi:hypothetical protein
MSGNMRRSKRRGNLLIRVVCAPALSELDRAGGQDVMSGHQEFKALSSDEVQRAAERIAEMEKWAREAYLSTKQIEDVEGIWVRYFEAEHHLHFIIPPATEPEEG